MRWLTEPSGIAIVGASQDFTTINGKILKYLLKHGYSGKVYPVNPRYPEIAGLKCYSSVTLLPEVVDLALIAVSATRVPDIIRECGRKGIKGAVIFSSGFAEMGDQGKVNQAEMLEIAKHYGIRLIGPNCLGVLNVPFKLTATFSASLEADQLQAGVVSLVSQSGAVGFMIFNLLQELGVGVNLVITTGNEADLKVGDALLSVVEDPKTKVILSYIEGLRDSRHVEIAAKRALELDKPIIVLKAGKSESGRSAAATHTAALTGSEEVYRGFFKKFGMLEVQDTDELLDLAQAFALGRLPQGQRVGIITMSGGVGILLADQCEANGLTVPHLSEELQAKIRKVIPSFGCAQNPIDVTAQSLNQGNEFKQCVNLLLNSEEIDVLIVAVAMATGKMAEKIGKDIADCAREASKPLVVAWTVGQVAEPGFFVLREAGVPLYHSPARAAKSVAALYQYAASRERRPRFEDPMIHEDRQAKVKALLDRQDNVLTERESKEVLSLYDLPVTHEFLAKNLSEAIEKAEKIGYPIVLKVDSPDILHKTEVGGVRVNLQTSSDVQLNFREIIENAKRFHPDARINGVLVQEQVESGVEAIVGIQNDPIFGPQIVFGLGGIFVEVLKDVTLRPLPLSREEAQQMLGEIKGAALLTGIRGKPPVDQEALLDLLLGVSQFALEAGEQLVSLDLNPVTLLPQGQGVKILDAVLVTRGR